MRMVGRSVLVASVMLASPGCNEMLGWDYRSSNGGAAPSCDGEGTDTCAGQLNDCCDSLVVAGCEGTSCNGNVLPGFRLDAFEVTVARYRVFLADPKHAHRGNFAGCIDATFAASGNDEKPINWVTLGDARTFCEWDAARLPTLTQLQRAAMEFKGSADDPSFLFPWGGEPDSEHVLDYATIASKEIRFVGAASKGKGKYGHFDLLGNVQEWTEENRVYGRSFSDNTSSMGTSVRTTEPTGSRDAKTGFRCARDL